MRKARRIAGRTTPCKIAQPILSLGKEGKERANKTSERGEKGSDRGEVDVGLLTLFREEKATEGRGHESITQKPQIDTR